MLVRIFRGTVNRGKLVHDSDTTASSTLSSQELQRQLTETTCDCGGTWHISDYASPLENRMGGAGASASIVLQCGECGLHQAYVLSAPDSGQADAADDEFGDDLFGNDEFDEFVRAQRLHHYEFAHVALRGFFFKDPQDRLARIRAHDGQQLLCDFWDYVGKHLSEQGAGAWLPTAGLAVEPLDLPGWRGVIVHLPPPAITAEAHFIALAVGLAADDGTCRYVLSERTLPSQGETGCAVLCEWKTDGSHANYGALPSATLEDFRQALAAHLPPEDRQGQSGPAGMLRRYPAAAESPAAAVSRDDGFRAQLCIFAFEVVPASLGGSAAESAVYHEQPFATLLPALWQKAAAIARSRDFPELPLPAGLALRLASRDGQKYLVVQMPPPQAAPEPYLLAVRYTDKPEPLRQRLARWLGRADNAGAHLQRTVYALEHCVESESGAALFTTLSADGRHTIVGTLESTNPDRFLDAVCACEAGKSSRFFNGPVSSQQSLLYAALKNA